MNIDSFVITKVGTGFTYNVNNTVDPDAESGYEGSLRGRFITIKSITGGAQVLNVPYEVMSYIDPIEPSNNLSGASSAEEMFFHLDAQGFFGNGSDGGGTGGVTTFKALLDTFPSFAGKSLYIVRVNEGESKLEAVQQVAPRLQDLSNAANGPTVFPPNRIVRTTNAVDEDGNAVGFIFASDYSLVNRPPLFEERIVISKGVTYNGTTIVANPELYSMDYGDEVSFGVIEEPSDDYPEGRAYKYYGIWQSGLSPDLDNCKMTQEIQYYP